jgi:hypothetical protein
MGQKVSSEIGRKVSSEIAEASQVPPTYEESFFHDFPLIGDGQHTSSEKPSAPIFQESFGQFLRETSKKARDEANAKVDLEIHEHFDSLSFFVDMEGGLANLSAHLMEVAKKGGTFCRLRQKYESSSQSGLYLGIMDISEIWLSVLREERGVLRTEWAQWNGKGKTAFQTWVQVNLETFKEAFQKRTQLSMNISVERDLFLIEISW